MSSAPASAGAEDLGDDRATPAPAEATPDTVVGETAFGEELPSALGIPEIEERPAPVAVSIPSLGLDGVVIEPVGGRAGIGVMTVPAEQPTPPAQPKPQRPSVSAGPLGARKEQN